MSILNSMGHVEGASTLLAAGFVTGSSGALSLQSGPLAHQSGVSVSRSATGTYAIVLNPFKAPLGSYNVLFTVQTASRYAYVNGVPSYSGDALTVNVKTQSIGTTPADADSDFYFQIYGF